jgi:hypothetical protein
VSREPGTIRLGNYREIIQAIPVGHPFSIHELSTELHIHPLRIRRVFNCLRTIRYLERNERKAYRHRVWSTTPKWLSHKETLTAFEWWVLGYPRAFYLATRGLVHIAKVTNE